MQLKKKYAKCSLKTQFLPKLTINEYKKQQTEQKRNIESKIYV